MRPRPWRTYRVTTFLLHHAAFLDHLTPIGHPERPDRLRALHTAL